MSNSNIGKNNKQAKRLLNTIIKGDFNMIFSKLLYKILGSFSKEPNNHPLEFTKKTAAPKSKSDLDAKPPYDHVEATAPAKPKKPRKPKVVK